MLKATSHNAETKTEGNLLLIYSIVSSPAFSNPITSFSMS